jgi:hypothetical protein
MSSLRCAYSFLHEDPLKWLLTHHCKMITSCDGVLSHIWTWCELRSSRGLNFNLGFFVLSLSFTMTFYPHLSTWTATSRFTLSRWSITSFYPPALKVRIFSLITKERISYCHQYFWIANDKAIGYNKYVGLSRQKYRRNIHFSVQPQSNISKVANNKNILPELVARIQRMEGALLDGNEAFPLWVAAIVTRSVSVSRITACAQEKMVSRDL